MSSQNLDGLYFEFGISVELRREWDSTVCVGFLTNCLYLSNLSKTLSGEQYRVVQQGFTPVIEVFYMVFDRSLSISIMTDLKQQIKYFHFRCKIQLDLPVIIN